MKLLFVGDVMLGRLINEVLRQSLSRFPWGDTLSVFKTADIRICNLECVIADTETPWTETPKAFHFRSDSKNAAVLKAAGIDCVSLANNHTLDFGYEALLNMITSLDRAGIQHAGAGPDLKSASQPAIITCNGMRIGCVAFTDNEPAWEATPTRPGVFYVPVEPHDARLQTLLDVIADVRHQVDYLIVSAHWGSNWGYEPQPQHIPFAHILVDNGADIVFGHSCHVFQGIELYRSRPILYSCGDFIDDYRVNEVERNDESFIFVVEANKGVLERLRLYPTLIHNLHSQLAQGTKAEGIGVKMQWLCKSFDTLSTWNRATGCLEIPIADKR